MKMIIALDGDNGRGIKVYLLAKSEVKYKHDRIRIEFYDKKVRQWYDVTSHEGMIIVSGISEAINMMQWRRWKKG